MTVHTDTADLGSLLEAAGRGELTTAVEHTYPLTEATDAHRRQKQGGLGGKLVPIPDRATWALGPGPSWARQSPRASQVRVSVRKSHSNLASKFSPSGRS